MTRDQWLNPKPWEEPQDEKEEGEYGEIVVDPIDEQELQIDWFMHHWGCRP